MTELRIHRVLPAPPERVWRALTDPAALVEWFWPRASYGTVAETDPRPGGKYRIDAPKAGIAAEGEYVTVEPPHRLVMTWRWADEPTETLVTIELEDTAEGTALTLLHEHFDTDEARDGHEQGWSDCLDRMPQWLASHAPSV